MPGLVGADQVPSANALMQIIMQVGQVLGPALAGLLIAQVDLAAAFWVDVATFGAAIVALLLMQPMPPIGGTTKAGFKSIAEGLRYLKGRQALQGTFVIDINAMVFGMPRALFPELAQTVFGGGAGVTGLLYAAPGAGALLGALGSGWVSRVHRQGRAVLVSVLVVGARDRGVRAAPRGCRWRCCSSRSPAPPTSCPPSSATRSCSCRCPTGSAVGSRRCTSRSSPAARGWATRRPARRPR